MHTAHLTRSFGIFVIGLVLLGVSLFAQPLNVHAAGLTETQIQAILTLLSSFGADSTTITAVNASLRGQATSGTPNPSGTAICIALTHALYRGVTDATTNGEVTRLQKFLGMSDVTGYFGPLTEQAVQKWQRENDVVSSGTADSTGYGYVGVKTRARLQQNCNQSSLNGTQGTQGQGQATTTQTIYTSATLTLDVGQEGAVQVSQGAYRGVKLLSITSNTASVSIDGGASVSISVGGTYLYDNFKLQLQSVGENKATFLVVGHNVQ